MKLKIEIMRLEKLEGEAAVGACRDGRPGVLVGEVREKSIVEHPDFYKPHDDWGVVAAYTSEECWDEETGEHFPAVHVPEDRSGWRPEWDGKALADFWDMCAGDWVEDCPGMIKGVQSFLVPVVSFEPAGEVES